MIQAAEALAIALAVGGPAAMLFCLLALFLALIVHPGAAVRIGII